MSLEDINNFANFCSTLNEPLSLGGRFHRYLRASIIRASLLPGQPIFEVEMSNRFAISRQPVREAFISLRNERLIEVQPKIGTYVRKISLKEVLDTRHVREVVEVAIVQEVARQHKKELIDTLRHLVAQQRKVKHGDNHAFLLLDDALHRAIALHAGREFAWRVIDSAKAQMDRVRFLSYDLASPLNELIDDHALIIDAIEANDAAQAARITEIHVRKVLQTLPQVAQHYPDYFIE